MIVGRDAQVAAVATALDGPGVTVVAGLPGSGKTTVARAAAGRLRLPIREAGALATLSHVPGLPLSRAIRAALPADDVHLAVEAVRTRVGGAVLLLDDAQWCDRLTLSVLPALAETTRIVATVRTPAPHAESALAALRAVAATWLELPPLDTAAAVEVVRSARPELAGVADDDPAVAGIVQRAGGNPLALQVLAGADRPDVDALHGIAALVAELPQDERTALAALGLLGRPAQPRLLGRGAGGLRARGLTRTEGRLLVPGERFVAEVAAGVLPDELRRDMHRRLAELIDDDAEAARHLAAAGDDAAAARRALRAGRATTAVGARAELLLFALHRDPTGLGTPERVEVAIEVAQAALDAGLPAAAADVLAGVPAERPGDSVRRAVLRAEAAVARGATVDNEPQVLAELVDCAAAAEASAGPEWRVRHAVARIRLTLPADPAAAAAIAEPLVAGADDGPPLAGLRAAYGQVLLSLGDPRWESELRTALCALDPAEASAGDPATFAAAAQVAAVLCDGLREECRTETSGEVARVWVERAAGAGAYTWEVVFRARQLWARLHAGHDGADSVVREGTTLLERSAPAAARAVLVPTVALAYADGGAIPTARRLLAAPGQGRLARWVSAETAWLHGDADAALAEASRLSGHGTGDPGAGEVAAGDPGGSEGNTLPEELAEEIARADLSTFDEPSPDLAAALARLTTAWTTRQADGLPPDPRRPPVTATLQAVRDREIAEFVDAAREWDGVMLREAVRCLLAAAELDGSERAVPWLRDAEHRAEAAGLALLLGRVRRALRQHGVVRRDRAAGSAESAGSAGSPYGLSPRELEAMRLVGLGHSTRRIAELLGITRNTAETYVKSAMGKLGARTRTEAAVLAADLTTQRVNAG